MQLFPLRIREVGRSEALLGTRRVGLVGRLIVPAAIALLLAAPGASAQQKIKDEGLHQYLVQEFARLNERLDKLSDRLTAAENRLSQLEKGQESLAVEEAQTETSLKSVDTSLSSLRLNTQQELFEVKTGVVDLKAILSGIEHQTNAIADEVRKTLPPPPPPPNQVTSVGYLDTTDAANWTINLGTADNVRQGEQFHVYHLNSGESNETEAGIVEVTEVVEVHKSRVKVISSKPDVKIDFGDIVRPL